MGIDPRGRDSAEFPDSPETILAYLKAVLEDGDAKATALALNDVARAKGLAQDPLTAQSDIASLIVTLKALGLQLAAQAASKKDCATARR
ncbi:MAG TPA: hypothetical protein VFP12_00325 [Allosphingosinicella sp.]|nr:hypothetical protein [Allosphingosinicella sp.]